MQKMEGITGVSADFTFDYASVLIHKSGFVRDNYGAAIDVENNEDVIYRGGVVHDENRERDYWKEEGGDIMNPDNGTRPGQYSNEEIKQIMDYRSQEDIDKEIYIFCKNLPIVFWTKLQVKIYSTTFFFSYSWC